MIEPLDIAIKDWTVRIYDKCPSTRNHENTNKYNWMKNDRQCKYNGCTNTIRKNRSLGLCDDHKINQHDLFLEVINPKNESISPPRHKDIIDALMLWASTRNFSLDDFFSELAFNVLGNIPDVTSLSGDIRLPGYPDMPNLTDIYRPLNCIIDKYFPVDNTSSYQEMTTKAGNMSAILLANIFVGLLVCEEANRGNRWFSRNIIKDETRTNQLGAAMPLAYYAARSFRWGVELNNSVAHKLTL